MELLGPSLESVRAKSKNFSLETISLLGEQLINRIEILHSKRIIHRDIKPENTLIGLGTKHKTLYLIDFGLSKVYKDRKSGNHIPFKTGKKLTGTARYASVNTHLGLE